MKVSDYRGFTVLLSEQEAPDFKADRGGRLPQAHPPNQQQDQVQAEPWRWWTPGPRLRVQEGVPAPAGGLLGLRQVALRRQPAGQARIPAGDTLGQVPVSWIQTKN